MNIDRDDEYATRYEAAPTIEEQIECCRKLKEKMQRMSISDPMNDAILASLEKLAAIESQPVPVEPVCVKAMRMFANNGNTDAKEGVEYIESLQSALHRAQEKYEQAVSNKQIAEAQCAELLQRAEKAEAELKLAQEERDAANDKALRVLRGQFTQICSYCGWEANREGAQWTDLQSHIKQCEHHPLVKAESLNRRMVELLKEPSEGMIASGYPPNDERAQSWGVTEVFKAMSAELLKEVEK